jgi:hypothetical protein
VQATNENSTILLEILKYYGRDINIVEAWNQFKAIHKRGEEKKGYSHPSLEELDEGTYRSGFLRALSDLKVQGFVSTTKQNTFIFKKNIFGKAKLFKSQSTEDHEKVQEEIYSTKFK